MRDARPADKRESNLELLRIIMMVLIVAHHFAYHGGFEYPWQTVSLNRLWIQLMMIGGKLGVDVFVLISGYFLINAERLKTVRPVRMWFQLLTYSLVPFCLLAATGQVRFTAERLLHSLLPIAYDGWWFASAYFSLYLFAPFIDRFLRAMDRNEYRRFLLILMTARMPSSRYEAASAGTNPPSLPLTFSACTPCMPSAAAGSARSRT